MGTQPKQIKSTVNGNHIVEPELPQVDDTALPPVEEIELPQLADDVVDELLKHSDATDVTNAEIVKQIYGKNIAYVREFDWLWYTGSHWSQVDGEVGVKKAIIATFITLNDAVEHRIKEIDTLLESLTKAAEVLDDLSGVKKQKQQLLAKQKHLMHLKKGFRTNMSRVRGCMEALQVLVTVPHEDFDQTLTRDFLNCANGVVDLRTGNIIPHSHNQRYMYCVGTDYKPYRKSKLWERFLDTVLQEGDGVREFLQTCMGYSVTGHTREEKFFYLQGQARAGKGTFVNTISDILGKPLSIGTSMDTFMSKGTAQSFELAPLKDARLVSASESERNAKINEKRVKALIGRDQISCAFKGKDFFSYTPSYKIWMLSNFEPRMDTDDKAVWGRTIIFKFPNSYLGKEDTHLKDNLLEQGNREAILAWCVAGAKQWYALPEGRLTPPPTIIGNKSMTMAEQDYMGMFLEDYITITGDINDALPRTLVYQDYLEWAKENGFPVKGRISFGISLGERGVIIYNGPRVSIPGKKSSQMRAYYGVKWRAERFSPSTFVVSQAAS